MRSRTQSLEKLVCHGCGREVHIAYDEGFKLYCFSCAFSYGAIDEDVWREDSMEEELLEKISNERKK